ncbi:UNVERIFIED_CONTAM: hypothetical protein GTU68_001076 [Idotea baltica]|nr:hypothetical protein [Idotea baltica]
MKLARENGLSGALLDRLELTPARLASMIEGVRAIASQDDPLVAIKSWVRSDGLRISKQAVPLGVIAVIYESRPNVTADAAALALRSGNAVLLRGGKEAAFSNQAISDIFSAVISEAGLSAPIVQQVLSGDRTLVDAMLQAEGQIDLLIPRGGESLIRAVAEKSRVPVLKHYNGICHLYVDSSADLQKAEAVILNAKIQRPGVCNALETLLLHKDVAQHLLEKLAQHVELELRLDLAEEDWNTEYLDTILSVRIVESMDEAVDHIARYSSAHTDGILSQSREHIERFVRLVDSSAVVVNASTRFNDGAEFGMGAEIGISTDRLHARGPVGAAELTTYKFIVEGDGHIRS